MNHRSPRLLVAFAFFLGAALLLGSALHSQAQTAVAIVVNSIADTDDGKCDPLGQGTGNRDCTLREAINAANSIGSGAVISFNLSGTITLGSTLPNITANCTVDGSGQIVTVSGNDVVGIFQVRNGQNTVNFNALTVAHSFSNLGALSVRYANVNVTNCTFNDNSSNSPGAALNLTESTNTSVANCTFFNNSASYGGGIFIVGVPNGAPSAVRVYSSTFYNNHGTFGTGTYQLAAADIYASSATAEIRNTVLINTDFRAYPETPEDNAQGLTYADKSDICNVDIDSQTFNATQASAEAVNLDNTLRDNGGSAKTLALLPGSVAINTGNNSAATAAPVNNQDQRGYVRIRPDDSTCDVGAYESGSTGSLVVNTLSDLTTVVGAQNSLRTAFTYAQQLGGAQTITFTRPLAGQTIALSNPWDNANSYNSSSALRVDGNITIQGPASAPGITLTVADTAPLRHFVISGGGTLVLQNLTLSGGKPTLAGYDFGGAVWSFGTLAVQNCTFTGNTAGSEGGAIQSNGDSPSLSIDNSTFTGNHSNGIAGAIDCGSVSMTFRYVTISNNTAPDGTALVIWGHPLTMVNGLIAGNGNEGAGSVNGGTFSAASTNNIFSSATAPGLTNGTNANQLGVSTTQLRLAALASNGGPTQTIALQPGSVAVDAGVAIAGITTDQVGTTRPQGNAPDAGSFELIPMLVSGLYTDVNGQGGNGAVSLVGYSGGTTPGFTLLRSLNSAAGMVFDAAGNLYFTAYDSNSRFGTVNKLAAGSSIPQNIVSLYGQPPSSLAINTAGDAIYVLTNGDFSTKTTIVAVSLTGAFGPHSIYYAPGMAVGGAAINAADDLYFVDTTNQQIRVIPTLGGSSSVFVSGVPARGLAFDRSGNLFASTGGNPGNDSVLKFTPTGAQSTFAAGLANAPLGLAFDGNGDLFVAENGTANQAGDIIRVTPDGTKSTFDSNLGPALPGGNGGPQYLAIFPGSRAAVIPIISPLGGTYESSATVTITSASQGTTIRYTLDGSTPSETHGQIYSGAFTLTQSVTVKAIATGGGWIASPIASVGFTILPPLSYWRLRQGLPAEGTQDLATPAGDGVANLLRDAFNLAPNPGDLTKPNNTILAPGGIAGLPLISSDAQGRLVVEFVRRNAAGHPGIVYNVETGDDLSFLAPLDLSTANVVTIDSTWERVTVVDPAISLQRFGRVRVATLGAYYNTFDGVLGPAQLFGSATYANGAVQLTDNSIFGEQGGLILSGIGVSPELTGFTANFFLALGPTTGDTHADGASFAVGDLLQTWGEGGPGTSHGLAVGFDTYENGGTGSSGIHVWVNGVHVAASPVDPYTNGALVPVEVTFDGSHLTVEFNGLTIFSELSISGFQIEGATQFHPAELFGFGARTGAATEAAAVDQVQIEPIF